VLRADYTSPPGEYFYFMGQVDAVEFLAHPLWRLGAQHLALSWLMRFDLIDDQFDFPALMIQSE